MKAALALSVLLILSLVGTLFPAVNSIDADANSWITVTTIPFESSYYEAAALDGAIYVMGNGTNYRYDLTTNSWLEKTSMPTQRSGPKLAVCQNKIYAIGGYGHSSNAMYLNVNEVYDPATDTWEERTPMPVGKLSYDACVVDEKIYLIGGAYPFGPRMYSYSVDSNYVYDPISDSWSTMAPLPHDVKGYASAVLDGKVYIMGGQSGAYPVPNSTKNYVQVFDPETNSWSEDVRLPINVKYAAGVATTGEYAPKRIYVVSGDTANDAKIVDQYGSYEILLTDANQVFNPEEGTWVFGAHLPKAQASLSLVNVHDVLYAVGVDAPEGEQHLIQRYSPANVVPQVSHASPTPTYNSPAETALSSPSIPEFPLWIILPLALMTVFSAVTVRGKGRRPLAP